MQRFFSQTSCARLGFCRDGLGSTCGVALIEGPERLERGCLKEFLTGVSLVVLYYIGYTGRDHSDVVWGTFSISAMG